MTLPPRPVPDHDSAPFWEGLKRHELLVQRCDYCGELQFPFRPACTKCASTTLSTVAVSGRGTVLSSVVTHRVFHPAFAERVPYTTVLVQLDEGDDLLMYGMLSGASDALREGERVLASFVDYDGFTLAEWTPLVSGGGNGPRGRRGRGPRDARP